jgi:hypothetical protein
MLGSLASEVLSGVRCLVGSRPRILSGLGGGHGRLGGGGVPAVYGGG